MLGRRVTREVIGWIIAGWLLLVLHRTAFMIAYWAPETPLAAALSQFFLGLRFDISTLPLFVFAVVLLLPLVAAHKRLRTVLLSLNWLWFGCLNSVLIASTFNYGVNNKHLGWEFFAYFNDFSTLMSGVLSQVPIFGTIYLLLLPLIAAAGIAVERRRAATWPADRSQTPSQNTWSRLPAPIRLIAFESAAALILFFGLRGGLQQSPLRVGDAMRADSAFLNNVPLTGLFTIAHDAQDMGDFKEYSDKAANRRYTQNLLDSRPSFVSEKFPLLRRMPARPLVGPPPNIVLVILESFTAKFLARNGGDPTIAPETNALSRQGIYFKHFISSGGRSANGIFSMMCGIPDRAGRTILRSASVQNRFGGLPMLLKEKGYQTFFVHGGDLSFDHLDTALPHFGMGKAVGAQEIESMRRVKRPHAWGFDDETTFDVLLETMRRANAPFFGTVFTQNTHHPFFVPEERFKVVDPRTPQHEYLNAYHYTDHYLGDFVRRASREPSFKNTVFLFVADHASHSELSYMEDREVVFFIYAPGRLPPSERGDIASHLDLLPTVLGLAGGGLLYAAMGRDLLRPAESGKEFAFFAGGSNTDVIGWVEGDALLVKSFHHSHVLLLRTIPPLGPITDPVRMNRFRENAENFHQFARTLEKENRIWPDSREMELLSRK